MSLSETTCLWSLFEDELWKLKWQWLGIVVVLLQICPRENQTIKKNFRQDNLSPSRDSNCELPSCKSTAPPLNLDLVAAIRCRPAVSYKGISRGTMLFELADACTSIRLNCTANNEWSMESSTEQVRHCFRINIIDQGSSLQDRTYPIRYSSTRNFQWIIIMNRLTSSWEQNFSWEVKNSSACQEVCCVLCTILCLWFRASLIYINNCPTRCNTKQSIYYSASSLYMFRVSTTPIIRITQNYNYSHVGGR